MRKNECAPVFPLFYCFDEGCPMIFALPIVVMVFFSALYTGAYIWMRRASFGESEGRKEKGR
jgi:hypothetical protein